ncbi:dehydrogenase-like protein [Perkinsela sp. CCAP 1560/4]|nr:dehydrogenase-like protein [Perkinsela sp. CCAP 1560/4]|eukprot:KNH09676.1 dehydrogenase-like protein [Perkinsela sp. CCAP 1560/4]
MNKTSLNVALVGLSTLGHAIARNIAFKSRSAVYLQLYNPSNTKKMRFVCDAIWQDGAQCAIRMHTDKRTLLKWSDVIIFATPASLTYELLNPGEKNRQNPLPKTSDMMLSMMEGVRPGQIFIDHSASVPEHVEHMADHIHRRGATYLDIPYNGNAAQAKQGSLTLMAGGALDVFNKVLPLLRLYAESITHMGKVGSGVSAKMILQQLIALHSVAAAEAMTVAHHSGLNESKLLSVLDSSWASSVMLRRDAPAMESLLRNPDSHPPQGQFNIRHVYDDLKLLLTNDTLRENLIANKKENIQLPFTSTAFRMFQQIVNSGMGDCEMAALVHFLGVQSTEGSSEPVADTSDEQNNSQVWEKYTPEGAKKSKQKKGGSKRKKTLLSLLANQQGGSSPAESY